MSVLLSSLGQGSLVALPAGRRLGGVPHHHPDRFSSPYPSLSCCCTPNITPRPWPAWHRWLWGVLSLCLMQDSAIAPRAGSARGWADGILRMKGGWSQPSVGDPPACPPPRPPWLGASAGFLAWLVEISVISAIGKAAPSKGKILLKLQGRNQTSGSIWLFIPGVAWLLG